MTKVVKPNLYLTSLLASLIFLATSPCLMVSFLLSPNSCSLRVIHDNRSNAQLFMGKGDGKKKRKKKSHTNESASTSSSAAPPASSPVPLRVTNSINIPIKRQIKWAKINQQIKNSQSTSFRQSTVKRTSYRKQLDESSHSAMLDNKKRLNSHVNWDVILSHGNGTSAGPLMLVDGYNVIHQWSRLKKHMIRGNTHMARDLLIRDLEQLHSNKGWRIECVFDGFGRKSNAATFGDGPGNGHITSKPQMAEREVTIHDTNRGVRVCYSGIGASADSYIEKRCLDAKSITQGKTTGSLIVVSNDAMIKMVGASAGALCMSSEKFVDELKAVKKVTQYRVEAAMAIVNSDNNNYSGHNVDNDGNMAAISNIKMQGAQGAGMLNAVGLSEVDGVQVINTFRGGQFIIEDKRLRKKKKKAKELNYNNETEVNDSGDSVEETSTNAIPSWAMLPDDSSI